jgi:hypothetical protein
VPFGEQQAHRLRVGAHERSLDDFSRPQPHAIGRQLRAARNQEGECSGDDE